MPAMTTLILGDCLDKLRELPDNSVDSIVTDPPYGLGKEPDALAMLTDWIETGHHDVKGRGFMGKEWDAFVPQPQVWHECLRVLKPGGHLLAFAGTRTQDLMTLGLRLAGFEIRDVVAWVYGSGFPKSLDVSKAIDKQGGGEGMPENDRKAFAAELREKREAAGVSRQELASWFPQYLEVTKNWERQDVGFRVPSEPDYQILVDRLGVSESWRIRVRLEDKRRLISEDLQDRRGDETVIGLGHSGKEWAATTDAAKQWDGWGTALKPALEPITLARKPLEGTVAGNVLKWHTGALNIDGCRVETSENLNGGAYAENLNGGAYAEKGHCAESQSLRQGSGMNQPGKTVGKEFQQPQGRWPANLIHDGSDEAVAGFPHAKGQQGAVGPQHGAKKSVNAYGDYGPRDQFEPRGDTGSAARFFYCAKASRSDRGEGNNHPTVKPTDLMRYLCRLITPPGGKILDPYLGSGSTGIAAQEEGFEFVGIERDEKYFQIARERILGDSAFSFE